MARQKVKTIFNKNHITIEEIENPEFAPYSKDIIFYEQSCVRGPGGISYWWDKGITHKKIIKKESPLGFYYTQEITETKHYADRNKGDVSEWTSIIFRHEDTLYRVKFLTRWNDYYVRDTEDSIRPWEVHDKDKSLNDNMLNALFNDMENFFKKIKEYNITTITKSTDWRSERSRYRKNIDEFKYEIYKILFGNKNGIRFQTDTEKILSHGFDLKYSFRKDKEQK